MKQYEIGQEMPHRWSDREKLREKGQFWTPLWVARPMVAYVIPNSELVYDPATGCGIFLRALRELGGPDIPFYGTDIDNLLLSEEVYFQNNCKVEQRDFVTNPPLSKFKSIIANPPYIRHHRLDAGIKTFLRRLCFNITGFTIDGRAGYHNYFLLQGLNSLAQGGRLAFIMPADTFEGVSSKRLWQWIASHYCIDGVITFTKEAAPFPMVDTNAIIVLIRNDQPSEKFFWIRCTSECGDDLTCFIESGFKNHPGASLEISLREIKEALETGFSRPERSQSEPTIQLSNFAHVKRGIATGANDFFFLTPAQVSQLQIPMKYFKLAIGKTRQVRGDTITSTNLAQLAAQNTPIYLLSLDGNEELPEEVIKYLQKGEKMQLHNRPLIKQRRPWYKMEKRLIPPILFAYLGRRNIRFIKNSAGVLPLTGFLCVYPLNEDKQHVDRLWRALNHPTTISNLALVGKSYGSQAIKVEPRGLERLPIPEHLVREFSLLEGDGNRGEMNLLTKLSSSY